MTPVSSSSKDVFYSASSPEGASLLKMVLTKLKIQFNQIRNSDIKGIQIRFFVKIKDDKLILLEIDKLLGSIKTDRTSLKSYTNNTTGYEKLFLTLGPLFN